MPAGHEPQDQNEASADHIGFDHTSDESNTHKIACLAEPS